MELKRQQVTPATVGGMSFFIKPFPAMRAARISGELSSLVGPIAGSLTGILTLGTKKNDANGEVDFDLDNLEIEDVAPALSDALCKLSGEKIERMAKELLITSNNVSFIDYDGETKPLTLDAVNEIFCTDVQDMFVLCYYVIKVNYGNFFAKILPRFGVLTGNTRTGAVNLQDTESSTSDTSMNWS